MADRFAEAKAFKRALRRTYMAFYAGIGTPNPLQLAACTPLLRGHDALLVAPTATGKTEAAVAPLVERLLSGPRPPGPEPDGRDDRLRLLYLAPTKALCREMADRLGGNLSLFGRKVRLRTGDSPQPPKPVPFALVTTIESLDSLLARAPDALRTVEIVLIDEIHVVHGNARGDQLRVLLARLARHTDRPLQRVALSATVPDPGEVVRRYLRDGQVIVGEGRRALRLRTVASLEALAAAIREEGLRRVLCFADSRQAVEESAVQLSEWLGADRVMVHHAGMSARVRHDIEESMRTRPVWFCVATSTLEVGIDVGAIEAVALLQVPRSPSAFQQRVGRAGRRDAVVRVLGVASTDEQEDHLELLASQADRGIVEEEKRTTDPGVVVQQAFSMAFSRPSGVPEGEFYELLEILSHRAHLRKIVDHLVAEGHLQRRGGRLFASTAIMDLGVRGVVHANLPEARDAEVVDANTGKVIGRGTVYGSPGDPLVLGGRAWTIRKRAKGKVLVDPAAGAAHDTVARSRRQGPWARYLPVAYRTGFPGL